jgi:ABC-2 type transport system permease protein
MLKTFIVAQSEFATLVRSKAFVLGVLLMPVMMVGSIYLVRSTRNATDNRDRAFALVDHTGVLAAPLMAVTEAYNAGTAPGMPRTGARFLGTVVSPAGRSPDEIRLDLSDRVRREELFAFVEVPADVLDPAAKADIRYYSNHPSATALPDWLRATLNGVIMNERFKRAALDRALVSTLLRPATVEKLGLVARDARGAAGRAEAVDPARAFGVPMVALLLMYITVMSSGPQLLNTVIEEKMSRISEVLIGSITPFQLMMGKLLGSGAVSILLAAIYIAGGLAVAQYWGDYAGAIRLPLLLWFLVFLVLNVMLFGSLFVAIGAACSDLKDSQGMMTPVMIVVMIPLFTASAVLRAPDGLFATLLSIFPTTAPFIMLLRIALQPGPPAWQIAISVGLMVATAVGVVWAGARIFRVGLLMQGKSATFAEMIRWARNP